MFMCTCASAKCHMATDQCDVSNRVSGESEGVQKKATEKGERGGLVSKKKSDEGAKLK